jgi:protein TonB
MKPRALLATAVLVLLVASGAAYLLTRPKARTDSRDSTRPPVVETAPPAEAPGADAVAAAPEPAPMHVERKKPVSQPKKKVDVLVEPVQISRVEPQLPEAARRYHLHGDVVLKAQITREGNVESVTVVRGTHPLLDGAAERAVSLWKYRPAMVNGRAVDAPLQVTVSFKAPGQA